jgi:hypothetical protein
VTGELIVKLTSDAEPDEIGARAGVSLAPLHPGTSDPELAMYFVAQAAAHTGEDVAERLMRVDGVDSAYIKPSAAPP